MKIAMMIDSWMPELTGGGHVATWEISRRLVVDHGCQIDLITGMQRDAGGGKPPRIEEHYGGRLRILRIGPCCFPPESFLGKILYCLISIPRAARKRYDLINAQAFAAGFPGWIAGRLARIPVIYSVHGIGVNHIPEFVTNPLAAKFLAAIESFLLFKLEYDHQISVSRDIFSHQNANRSITIIPNGVDAGAYDAVTCDQARKFRMLYVGRFRPEKGLIHLIEALPQVIARHPGVEVLLVGTGSGEETLRNRIEELELEPNFEFAGRLDGNAKIRAYKSSHLFVLPSIYEGQPLTLLEAWAAKLPVVVTAVGANPDFVEDGIDGYLVPPGQANLLAAAILRAIENPELSAMGLRGYQNVRGRYSWERAAAATYQVYREVSEKSSDTSRGKLRSSS